MKQTTMSQAEYARHRGISRSRVGILIKEGKIPDTCYSVVNRVWAIDPEKADIALSKNLDQKHNRPGSKKRGKPKTGKKPKPKKQSPAEPTQEEKEQIMSDLGVDLNQTMAESQRKEALWKAVQSELNARKAQGLMVEKALVEKDAFELARRVRDAIMNVPGRISPELASMTDIHAINDKLTMELTQALEELAND